MSGQTVTDGTTHQSVNSTSVTDSLANAVSEADRQTQTRSKGETTGRSSSLSKSQAHARQNTSTRTTNLTFKQTLIPQIVTRNVVTSLQFHTKEEIEWAAAAKLKNLNTGEAVLMIDGKGVWEVLTPKANDPYAHAPKFAARKLIEWRQQLVQRPEFASPEQILTERQRFLEQLTAELGQLSQRPDAKRISLSESIPQSAPPLLIHPTDDDADPRVTL